MILKKIIAKKEQKKKLEDLKEKDCETPFLEQEILKIIQNKEEINKNSKKNPEEEFKNLIGLVKKIPRTRTNKEIITISRYLDKTEIIQKFKSNLDNDLDFIKNMLKFTSTFINYEFIEKDKILFNEGDIGNKFYIILKGSLRIIKYRDYDKHLTLLEYINHLELIRKEGDSINLKYTLKANKDKFPIPLDMKNLDDIPKIREKLELKKLIESTNDANDLKKIIEDYNRKNKFDNIVLSKLILDFSLNQKNISISQMNMIRIHCLRTIKDFRNIEDYDKPVPMILYEKHVYCTIKSGNYFGDLALEKKDQLRTATIQAEEDTHLGYLENKIYNELILKNKRGAELKEADYLVNKFFFNFVDKCDFLQSFFQYFFFMEKNKGETIFEEGEEMKYVYLIQEGEIEYIINDSIIGLSNIIKKLCTQAKFTYSLSKYEDDILKRFKRDKSLNCKKSFKIFKSSSEHVIGLDEFFFGIPKYFQGKVVSNHLKLYAIPIDKIKKMFEKSFNLHVLLENSTRNKINILIDRLIDIKNTNFDLFGIKYMDDSDTKSSLVLPQIQATETLTGKDNFRGRKSGKRNTIVSKSEYYMDFQTIRPNVLTPVKDKNNEFIKKENLKIDITKTFKFPAKNDLKFNIVTNKIWQINSDRGASKDNIIFEKSKNEELKKISLFSNFVKKIDNENYIHNFKINKNSKLNDILEKSSQYHSSYDKSNM